MLEDYCENYAKVKPIMESDDHLTSDYFKSYHNHSSRKMTKVICAGDIFAAHYVEKFADPSFRDEVLKLLQEGTIKKEYDAHNQMINEAAHTIRIKQMGEYEQLALSGFQYLNDPQALKEHQRKMEALSWKQSLELSAHINSLPKSNFDD